MKKSNYCVKSNTQNCSIKEQAMTNVRVSEIRSYTFDDSNTSNDSEKMVNANREPSKALCARDLPFCCRDIIYCRI